MGDYLESYADRFGMTVRTGVRIDRVTKNGEGYVLTARGRRFEADNVIVASGAMQTPKVPAFGPDLDPAINQMHSSGYRSPSQLNDGPVLIVGCGNSGAEIAAEIAKTHETFVSGTPSAQLPFKHSSGAARFVFPVIRFIGHHVLCLKTPIGRKVKPKFNAMAAPLIRVKTKDLEAAGVTFVARTAGTSDGKPVLEDCRVLDVANVIWCTGFRHTFGWVDVPEAFDDHGEPVHVRGVSETAPGLYFMGLAFQYAASSEAVPGVGRDGEHVAKHIVATGSVGRIGDRALVA
jgi:putative flavoprotein involved in K+ transport